MAKLNKFDRKHQQNLLDIQNLIDEIYAEAAKEAARIGVSLSDFDPDRLFSFADYPSTRKRVNRLLQGLKTRLTTAIINGVKSSWTLANNKNDELCRYVFGDNIGKLSGAQYRKYFNNNEAARDAFIARKTAGLNLSDRVWNYTSQFKREIELGLDVGMRQGMSADEMSRALRQFLKYPDKLFRRVREGVDSDGNPIYRLSKAASEFHPGRGVYRSSYKNARRLAATETNIAYRTADYDRWQQMDFIVGQLIEPSKTNHPVPDICDDLKGKYPKDFKFTGWHPHCRCHVISIMKSMEEMAEDNKRILRGEEPTTGSVNEVKDVPDTFKDWVRDNSDRIQAAQGQGSMPYFITDNQSRVDSILRPEVEKPSQTDDRKQYISQEKIDFIDKFNDGQFSNEDEIIEYAKNHSIGSKKYPTVIYDEEYYDAIEKWQDEGDVLVHMLQSGKPFKNPKTKRYAESLLRDLEMAMGEYTTTEDIVVYRVVRSEYRYDRSDYFVSVTTSPEKAAIFGSDTKGAKIQAFLIPKGTPAIVVGNNHQSQFEMIFNSAYIDFEKCMLRKYRK